jgi:hypothetical protein
MVIKCSPIQFIGCVEGHRLKAVWASNEVGVFFGIQWLRIQEK